MRLRICLAILLLATGCATKKAQPDTAATSDAVVRNQDINFDSLGSDSGRIAGLRTVHFDFDKSSLTPETRRILADNAKWILAQPESVTMTIEGHTDARGSIEYNLALGERRAKSVKAYLVSLGVSAERLTTLSYGKERLLINEENETAHSANRRANFVPVQRAASVTPR